MNAFERLEAKRSLLRSSIVPTWITFRSAVNELVASYNQIEEGKAWPARVEMSGDTSIVISSTRGMAPDQFHTLSLSIEMSLLANKCEIHAAGEEWYLNRGAKRKKDNFLSVEFTLDGDPESNRTWLFHNEKQFTPSEAAEAVLIAALLHQPIATTSGDEIMIAPRTISSL